MSCPLVSIVINNFNYCRYLRRAIDSALAQKYSHVEVVVVDDASTDISQDIVRSYGGAVTPILQSVNAGQGAALNSGFAKTRGDIIIFLDSDDYLYPDAAAKIVSAWKPGAAQLHYRLHLVDSAERLLDIYPSPEVSFDTGNVLPSLLTSGRFETSVTSGNAFARAALAEIMPMPEPDFRICADGYLVTLAPFYGDVLAVEEPLGAYRQHDHNNWSGTGSSNLATKYRKAIQHDRQKYAVLTAKAAERGLHVPADPGLNDYSHLTIRLASLRLEPDNHPIDTDTRLGLTMRGIRASASARLIWPRRILIAFWFLCVGLLPQLGARRAIEWRMLKQSRPPAIDRLMTRARRLTRAITRSSSVAK